MKTPLRRTHQIARHLSTLTMSGAGPAASSPAPWRAAFVSHIEGMDSPTFVLSSVHRRNDTGDPSPAAHGSPEDAFVPRARTVVYRGMWAGLTENPRNPAPRNPNVYQTDLLTITTDVRMEKVSEMFGHSLPAAAPTGNAKQAAAAAGAGDNAEPLLQSCIGGPVEGVLWAAQAKTQWRVRGRVCMIGPDIESDAGQPVRQLLGAHMRQQGSDGNTAKTTTTAAHNAAKTWGWANELTAHFGNLSPVMRGSFHNPPPGTPISQEPGPGLGLGQKVDDLHDEVARRNFRVLVIIPDQVDQVDLSDPERGRRWRHDLVNDAGQSLWTTTELWP